VHVGQQRRRLSALGRRQPKLVAQPGACRQRHAHALFDQRAHQMIRNELGGVAIEPLCVLQVGNQVFDQRLAGQVQASGRVREQGREWTRGNGQRVEPVAPIIGVGCVTEVKRRQRLERFEEAPRRHQAAKQPPRVSPELAAR
jgi:hypothetical protein